MLYRDIDDLEQWTADKVIIADSNELYQDIELLKERFQLFYADTQIGVSQRRIPDRQCLNRRRPR